LASFTDVRLSNYGYKMNFESQRPLALGQWSRVSAEDLIRDAAVAGQNDPVPIRHASFFSGIGGFDLGFERVGIETVSMCEKKPFCRRVLSERWPNTPLFEDIKNVNAEEIPDAEIWTAGFPCQDLSLARMGPRDGLKGSQSGLFHNFATLVGKRSPEIVILENVHGLLTSHRGRDFAIVLKTLDELGYGVAWRVFNSQYFGVPQSRKRVYVVAIHRDPVGAGEILFEPECRDRDLAPSGPDGKKPTSLFQTILGNTRKGPLVKARAHCIYAESARHTGTDWSRNYVWYPNGRVRRFVPVEIERIQGFPVGWTDIQNAGKDDPDSARYHAVGNSVTPSVAEWLGDRVARYIKGKVQRKGVNSSAPHAAR
jgi:DNA (cytosine-5)-methyltransferase 1